MNAQDPGMAQTGWARWLGLGRSRTVHSPGGDKAEAEDAGPDRGDVEASECTLGERRRRQLLEDVTRSILSHRLAVSTFTLEVAHDVVTGANPTLARMVAERVAQRQPVTLSWLEDSMDLAGIADASAQVFSLVRKLEASIARFSDTTSAVRSATSDYNEALAASVDGFGEVSLPGDESGAEAFRELTAIAREMLRRTRDIERELSRSERETLELQQDLADARREAEIDHLTGLPNRRAFEAVFREEFETTASQGEPLCVAFCDIDRFKRINDGHGHDAGDRVLRIVAQALATLSDDKCHVSRHGGEEFVVLLRGVALEEACAVLDRTREEIAARKLVNRVNDTPFGRISFSAGVADVHAHGNTREALRAADEALFRAKLAGRNRVMAAGRDEWSGFNVIRKGEQEGSGI